MVDQLGDPVEASLVSERLADGDSLFASRTKLGPVLGDGVVVLCQALVHQDVHQRGQHAFGGGEAWRSGIRLPGIAFGILDTAPDIHDGPAVMVNTHGGAGVLIPGNLADE